MAVLGFGLCAPALAQDAASPPEPQLTPGITAPPLWEGVPEEAKTHGKWAFEFGVGIIGATTIPDWLRFNFVPLKGPGEGVTYNFTATYRLNEFDWRLGHARLQPDLELPFMLTLVDQRVGGLTPDINLGLVFRWRDFPWNHYVYTTFAIGGGLSYSFPSWTGDEQLHPEDSHRSNFKFWLPVEFTFALPRYPRHQLTVFIDHQSGGHIFDFGGVDAWGFGYRFLF